MVIVFDGLDNAGKTTIATALQNKLYDHTYFKYSVMREQGISIDNAEFSRKNLHLFGYTSTLFAELSKKQELKLIMDRHFPSEFAYGQIYRSIYPFQMSPIDDAFSKIKNHLIIICHKSTNKTKDDEVYDVKDHAAIKQKFLDFVNWSKCNTLLLDTTSEKLDEQLATIMEAYNKIKAGEKNV